MQTYQAFVAETPQNNPDDFKNIKCSWKTLPLPELMPDEVQIDVHYSSLNYKDALAVTGHGKILRNLPLTPGIDAAGTVRASKHSQFKPGDKVLVTGCGLGETKNGGLGEVITVPGAWVILLPQNFSLKDAMILGTAGFTASLAIYQLEKNDLTPQAGPVLVTGATGGVGSLSLMMLSQLGYTTLAWTRKKEFLEKLKTFGATKAQDISDLDLKTRGLESAMWAGAIDNVGGDVLSYVLPRIQPHGSVAAIGLAKSSELKSTVFPFILRGVNLLGTSSATCPRGLRETIWQKIFSLKTDWSRVVRAEIAPQDVPQECQKIISGQTWGRVLVKMKG